MANATSAIIVGPFGGKGGSALFNDGWNNGGVSKLTIYFNDNRLQGFRVDYGDLSYQVHGHSSGTYTEEVSFSADSPLENISVYTGINSVFTGDPTSLGVVALGAEATEGPPTFPTNVPTGATKFRPQIMGFFGAASNSAVDSLGYYLSEPATDE